MADAWPTWLCCVLYRLSLLPKLPTIFMLDIRACVCSWRALCVSVFCGPGVRKTVGQTRSAFVCGIGGLCEQSWVGLCGFMLVYGAKRCVCVCSLNVHITCERAFCDTILGFVWVCILVHYVHTRYMHMCGVFECVSKLQWTELPNSVSDCNVSSTGIWYTIYFYNTFPVNGSLLKYLTRCH